MSNPKIEISSDTLLNWLREKVKEAGYPDSAVLAVQATDEAPNGEKLCWNGIPTLTVMLTPTIK